MIPLLRKRPTNIIIHVGTNNALTNNSIQIKYKLLKLKEYIISVIPTCKVIISRLINRHGYAKAQLTIIKTNELLSKLGIPQIDDSNITCMHLGKKGLHLNSHGTGKLVVNFLKMLKYF